MRKMNSSFCLRAVVLLPVSILGLSFAGGCQPTPPQTQSVDVGGEVSLERMQEYGATAADKIVSELSNLPPAKDPNGPRRVIYLADFINHTETPSGDFELFMKSLRSRLSDTKAVTHDFMILRDRAETQAMLNRNAAPGAADPLQEGHGGGPAVATYAPDLTYDLTGEFNDAHREGKSLFFISFQLIHASTGEIVVSSSHELTQH